MNCRCVWLSPTLVSGASPASVPVFSTRHGPVARPPHDAGQMPCYPLSYPSLIPYPARLSPGLLCLGPNLRARWRHPRLLGALARPPDTGPDASRPATAPGGRPGWAARRVGGSGWEAPGAMDALKALLEKKKADANATFGARKFVSRADLEAQRLKRLREEEAAELAERVRLALAWAGEGLGTSIAR